MEIVALSGLVAIGVAVSQLASAPARPQLPVHPGRYPQREGFQTLGLGLSPQNNPPSSPIMPTPSEYYTIGIQQYLTQEEAAKISELNGRLNEMAGLGNREGTQAMKAQIQTVLERAATRKSQVLSEPSKRAASNTAMAGTELDMMYKTPGGQMYPSEPNAGPK
jgi:hypothetical protein